jgi:ketosteroid isomerase-like protein
MNSASKAKTDEQRIPEQIAQWAQAVRERNMNGALANHSKAMVMFDVLPPFELRGIKEYQESWERFFAWLGETGGFEVDNLEVTAGSDVGFCHGTIRCRGGQASEQEGLSVRLTACLRKIDGEWIVMHEHQSEPAAD